MSQKRKYHDIDITKSYGDEPSWALVTINDHDYRNRIGAALNWASAVFEVGQFRSEVMNYLIASQRESLIAGLQSLKDWRFIQIGKLAWLHNSGCPLNELLKNKLESGINDLLCIIEDKDDSLNDADTEIKVSRSMIKDRANSNRISDLIAEIDEIIDAAVVTQVEVDESVVYKLLIKEQIGTKLASAIHSRLKDRYLVLSKEETSLSKISDEKKIEQFDSVETYDRYLDNITQNLNENINVINQLSSYLGNQKALKKSERKIGNKFQAKRIESQISNLNFKVQDNHFKVSSISPVSIVGAMTLIAFNTKTRKISIYVAKDEVGLSIKGTTIQNYDETLSIQKILKKDDMLSQLQQGSLLRVRTLFKDYIKAKESECNGRINEHTILLKTFTTKF